MSEGILMFDSTRQTQIRAACQDLQRDLVYQISLGSMGLFHSNFLAWLFDNVEGSAEKLLARWVIDDLGVRGSGPCLREFKRLDLVAYLPDRGPVVIENKVFGGLDARQLARYDATSVPLSSADAIGPETLVSKCHRVALTLLESPSLSLLEGWRVLRYDELLDWLDSFVIDAIPDGFEREFVVRYRNLLTLLLGFRNSLEVRDDNEPIELPKDTLVRADVPRLGDISTKVRMAALIDYLGRSVPPSSVVKYRFGFTRKSALVECFFTTPFEGHEVGWQYQGERLKIVVRLLDPTGSRFEGKRKSRENFVDKHFKQPWFDDVDFSDLMNVEPGAGRFAPLGGSAKSNSRKYLDYEPNFVYRYVPANTLTVGQLTVINNYLRDKAFATKWS